LVAVEQVEQTGARTVTAVVVVLVQCFLPLLPQGVAEVEVAEPLSLMTVMYQVTLLMVVAAVLAAAAVLVAKALVLQVSLFILVLVEQEILRLLILLKVSQVTTLLDRPDKRMVLAAVAVLMVLLVLLIRREKPDPVRLHLLLVLRWFMVRAVMQVARFTVAVVRALRTQVMEGRVVLMVQKRVEVAVLV
jgi:hypothetical protein